MVCHEREVCLIEGPVVGRGGVRTVLFSLICAAGLLWPGLGFAEEAGADKTPAQISEEKSADTAPAVVQHSYVGAQKCGMCHKSEAKGNQFKVWQESKHAQAYHLLASDEAETMAKNAGIEGDPQKAPECLKCHVTAWGVDTALLGEKFNMEDGVQCERCHGAGGDYAKMSIMKDKDKAIENGLIIPTEATCRGCHNEKSPAFKGFDFEERWKKIDHRRPETKDTPTIEPAK